MQKSVISRLHGITDGGTPSAKDKQAMLDEVNRQLAALNVGAEDQRAVTQPYVQLIAVDLYGIFAAVMDRYIQWKQSQFHTNTPDEVAEAKRFTTYVAKWR